MKIRSGFVSNSSSSSFTCRVCGRTESGWDLSLRDADMVETCEGPICDEEYKAYLKAANLEGDFLKEDANSDFWMYEINPKFDPFVSLYYITDKSLLQFLVKTLGRSADALREDIRARFQNLDELKAFIGGKK